MLQAGSGKQASKCREEDSRSVDELLAFIGEEPGGWVALLRAPAMILCAQLTHFQSFTDANKKKKGKRKGKKKAKPERSCDEVSEVHDANPSSAVTVDKGEKLELAARLANITVDDMSEIFNEFDDDDGLDPELKEKHERELAEFSKTLGLVPSVGCEQ